MGVTLEQKVIIVQARMGSTRLPGKVLLEVNGKELLSYLIERLKRVKNATKLIVATTEDSKDDVLVDFCHRTHVDVYRGSTDDVLSRYYEAAKMENAKTIIRITADCPLIDPEIVDNVIDFYEQQHFDYVSNVLERQLPRGMDVEVFSFDALSKAYHEAALFYEREHVTPYFYFHPELFKLGSYKQDMDKAHLRLTVDTPEDFELIKKIIEILYPINPSFKLEDIFKVLEKYPEWEMINKHVEQKKIQEEPKMNYEK